MEQQPRPVEGWSSRELLKKLVRQTQEGKYGVEAYADLPTAIQLDPAVTARVNELRGLTRQQGVEFGLTMYYEPIGKKYVLALNLHLLLL
ncbi:MAG: hypothetical protein KIH62_003480 [Candidatus Kerfeldbacteria bacterium]|nr:hypothetical protein [Candidatus Kerfeldbacteria bacterium]